jgi:hypothetical protein
VLAGQLLGPVGDLGYVHQFLHELAIWADAGEGAREQAWRPAQLEPAFLVGARARAPRAAPRDGPRAHRLCRPVAPSSRRASPRWRAAASGRCRRDARAPAQPSPVVARSAAQCNSPAAAPRAWRFLR